MKRLAFPLLFFLCGCLGPRPEIKEYKVHLETKPEPVYKIDVTIENRGRGDGQAHLVANLVDEKTGRTYKEELKVDLDPNETVVKRVEIHAPVARYRPEIKVEYPEM